MLYPWMTLRSPLACIAQAQIALGLKDLRNYMVFFFVVLNTLFILIVFMLTLSKDDLYIEWPFGIKENATMMEDTHEVSIFLTLVFFQKKIEQGLKELRDMAVFYFAMFNALFVLIVFMLTLNKDVLHIDWPFGIKENITITEANEV